VAEKRDVVDAVEIELETQAEELAVTALGRIEREDHFVGRDGRPSGRRDALDERARAAAQEVLHLNRHPDVVAPLRAGFDANRLEVGDGEIVGLPLTDDDHRSLSERGFADAVELVHAIVGGVGRGYRSDRRRRAGPAGSNGDRERGEREGSRLARVSRLCGSR